MKGMVVQRRNIKWIVKPWNFVVDGNHIVAYLELWV